ncbi:MAG: carboxymuconolactone decarboxylase family protein [Oceanipulchritudo sp.]
MEFQLHTAETASETSWKLLQEVQKAYGFIPNIYKVFAESPVALSTYMHITHQLGEHGALSPQEQQLVMLAVSESNRCEYCVAAHSTVAEMAKVPEETINALREGQDPEDPKEAALVNFARSVLQNQGWIPEGDQQAFLEAGYTKRHVLDVLSILALKTLSNYTNHLAETPLDEAFASHKWEAKD